MFQRIPSQPPPPQTEWMLYYIDISIDISIDINNKVKVWMCSD